jgi:hypothetical protein
MLLLPPNAARAHGAARSAAAFPVNDEIRDDHILIYGMNMAAVGEIFAGSALTFEV